MICAAIGKFQKSSFKSLLGTTALSVTFLAGCGGGGGGGSDGVTNPNFGNPQAFRTPEYNNSAALDQINAAEGYARISGAVGGDGVRVAVIDDGIDPTHSDLDDGRVVADLDAEDLGFSGRTEDDPILIDGDLVPDAHGTAVAGVIAGEKNGGQRPGNPHGVAFNSRIVSIDVFTYSQASTKNSDIGENLAAAIRAAGGVSGPRIAESDILNMSLGGPPQQDVARAMEEAARNNKIIVVATGNAGENEPSFPASFIDSGDTAGLGIAVGAVGPNNERAVFPGGVSNGCGVVARFCLVAPGIGVGAPIPDDRFALASGTSFAAPLVAGAAAVVKAAFPGLRNEEIVNRLLTTARKLHDGNEETSPIFGHGLLDLEAAIANVGDLSAALGTSLHGPKALVRGSQVSLDSSLALGGDAATLLADAIVFDEQNFPFALDLGRHVDRRSRATGLDGFVGANRSLSMFQQNDYGSLSLAFNDEQRIEDPYRAEFEESDVDLTEEKFDPQIRFQSELGDGVDVFMSLNGASATDLSLGEALAYEQGTFFQQSTFLSPFEKLAGRQSGGGAAYAVSDSTQVAVSAFAAADDEAATRVSMQKVELTHRTVGDIELRAGYGLLQEEGGLLGSATSGAFGIGTSTDSQYVNLSVKAPLTEKLSMFGSYTQGHSSTSVSSGVLDNFSGIRSEAFGAGLVVQGLAADDDSLSVMVGQPLRVTSGSADITVATGRTEDDRALTKTARADLTPSAREIATEAVYNFAFEDDDQSLSAGAFLRFNPDNDADASPDIGIGIKYRLQF